jgi:hypothetical protein
MATVEYPSGPVNPWSGDGQAQVVSYRDFIDAQLHKTRSQVRLVDILSHLVTLAAGVLGYLFLAAVVDHWLLPLGTLGRWLCLLGLVAGGGFYFARCIWPLIVRRIHPLYAATVIEQTAPSLKNSLINFLLLRGQRGVSGHVLGAVEQQAATNLSRVPVDSAVDRSRVVRLGYVLLAVVALTAAYKLFSPKDPLTTYGRIVAPWAAIRAPTRVVIETVRPGDTTIFTDEALHVSADVHGLRKRDVVAVHYWSADGRIKPQVVPLQLASGSTYQGEVPGDGRGLQSDILYYVAAGDARSPEYRAAVVAPPAITIKQVDYEYPKYTGLAARQSPQAEVTAIEGTLVTIRAEANQEILSARIVFNGESTTSLPMQASGQQAKGLFRLRMVDKPGSGLSAEYDNYQLRFSNRQRHENPNPVRYKIDVVRDQPPAIEITEPTAEEIEVPLDGSQWIRLRAEDADFALRQVLLLAERTSASGELILEERLLDAVHTGQFEGAFRFEPARLNLPVGETVRYWAVARDNREIIDQWQPNVTATPKLRIKIIEPQSSADSKPQGSDQAQPKAPQEPSARSGDKDHPPNAHDASAQGDKGKTQDQGGDDSNPQHPDSNSAQPKQSDPQAGSQNSSGGEEQQQDKIDPNADPGKAIEKIKQHADQQKQKNPDSQQPNPGNSDQPQQGDSQQGDPHGNQGGSPPSRPNKANQGDEQEPQGASGQQGGGSQSGPTGKSPSTIRPDDKTKPDAGASPQGDSSASHTNQGQQKGGSNVNSSGRRGDKLNPDRKNPPSGQEQPDRGTPGAPDPMAQDSKAGDDEPDGQPDQGQSAAGKGGAARGSGEQSKTPPKTDKNPNQQGGDPNYERGSGGAGQAQGDDKGNPEPQEKNQQQRDKSDASPPNDRPNPDAPKSPTTSPKESDSQGGEEGDRSGGGKDGGGQSSKNPGTGGAGSSTAADQGKSAAPGAGDGEDSQQPGSKTQAGRPTGISGQKAGDGSQARAGGSQSGPQDQTSQPHDNPSGHSQLGQAKPDQPAGPQAQSDTQPQGSPGSQSGGVADPTGQGASRAGGQRLGTAGSDDAPRARGGDDVNLQYAAQATDLVLEHLKDQLENGQPDQALLKELGWTREELAEFMARLQKIREQSKLNGPEGEIARNQLRNLGLRPAGTTVSGDAQSDALGNLRESARSAPPSEYLEQFRAYNSSKAKGRPKK